jgi:hypothetical protein
MAMLNKNRPLSQSLNHLKVALFEAGQNLAFSTFSQRTQHSWRHRNFSLPLFVTPEHGTRDPLTGDRDISHLTLRAQWGVSTRPLLGDHCMFDSVVVPGAFHLCVLLSHGIKDLGILKPQLNDVSFIRPLLMGHENSTAIKIDLQRQVDPQSPYAFSVSVESEQSGSLLSTGLMVEASRTWQIGTVKSHRQLSWMFQLFIPKQGLRACNWEPGFARFAKCGFRKISDDCFCFLKQHPLHGHKTLFWSLEYWTPAFRHCSPAIGISSLKPICSSHYLLTK